VRHVNGNPVGAKVLALFRAVQPVAGTARSRADGVRILHVEIGVADPAPGRGVGTLMPREPRYRRIASASLVSTEMCPTGRFPLAFPHQFDVLASLILMKVKDSPPSGLSRWNGSSYPNRSL